MYIYYNLKFFNFFLKKQKNKTVFQNTVVKDNCTDSKYSAEGLMKLCYSILISAVLI